VGKGRKEKVRGEGEWGTEWGGETGDRDTGRKRRGGGEGGRRRVEKNRKRDGAGKEGGRGVYGDSLGWWLGEGGGQRFGVFEEEKEVVRK